MRYFTIGAPVSLLPLLLLIAATACNFSGKTDEHEAVAKLDATTLKVDNDALENLKTAKAGMTDFPDTLAVMGKIGIPEDRTHVVAARVSGRIESIAFASGETVKAGQKLATLFSPDFVAAKEEYLQALKQSHPAEGSRGDPSDFANLTQMSKRKLEAMGLNASDIAGLSAGASGSVGGAAAANAPNDNALNDRLVIRAPRSGVIIAKAAVLGNLVNPGDTLFTIGDMSKVWFLGDLYPEDLAKVHKGQEIRVAESGDKKIITGSISFISPMIDPVTRTIKLRAQLENATGALRGDMYVRANVILNQNRALLVPINSVIHSGEGDFVFKRSSAKPIEKTSDSVEFKKVPVKLGSEQQGMVAVTEGLQDGDEVVSDGALLLDSALNAADKAK